MDDECMNNPLDPAEDRFSQLEVQVANTSRNLNLLVSAFSNMLWLLEEDGGSNTKERLEERLGDQEETKNQPNKGPKRDRPSSSVMNHSHPLFKME